MIRVLKITALVSVVVLLNAVTTLLFVQSAAPASAGPNCVNGDVNGDFVVDITDPIHLLGYIFEGTPVPVACAQNPSGITVDEMDFVLGRYFPKATDYVGVRLTPPYQNVNETILVYEVPQGKYFLASSVFFGDGTGSIVGQGVLPAQPEDYPALFYPGDQIFYTRQTNSTPSVSIMGHLLNAD